MTGEDQRDVAVRAAVYDHTIAHGVPPSIAELAERLGLGGDEVAGALERLAAGRVLVLQPASREVLMANPFSAVPTPFAVRSDGTLYFGNCAWDAFGIPAMLGRDARIDASCGCCSEAMRLEVIDGALSGGATDGVVHFAVPAHRWWQDIVYN